MDYTYDAMGRRVSKIVNGTATQYLYDGLNLIAELDASGDAIAWYVHTLNVDEPLARVEADEDIYYYHADILGSIVALTDSSGDVVTQYNYSPFGVANAISEGVVQPFRFTARELDAETGMYFYRARYYSPTLARFISEDPIRFASGDVNFYRYVGNNPVNNVDPLGLAGIINIPMGSYNFRLIPGDIGHGGLHVHVYDRRTGNLLGKINLRTGNVVWGHVPKKALKIFTKILGRLGGAASIIMALADPAVAGELPDEFDHSDAAEKGCK